MVFVGKDIHLDRLAVVFERRPCLEPQQVFAVRELHEQRCAYLPGVHGQRHRLPECRIGTRYRRIAHLTQTLRPARTPLGPRRVWFETPAAAPPPPPPPPHPRP